MAFVHGDAQRHTRHQHDDTMARTFRLLDCLDTEADSDGDTRFAYLPLTDRWINTRTPLYRGWKKRGQSRQVHACWRKFLSIFNLGDRLAPWPPGNDYAHAPTARFAVKMPSAAHFVVSRAQLRRFEKAKWAAALKLLASPPHACAEFDSLWVRGHGAAPPSDAKQDQALGGGTIEHLHHVVFGGLALELTTPEDKRTPTGVVFQCCNQLRRSRTCDREFHCAEKERTSGTKGNKCP